MLGPNTIMYRLTPDDSSSIDARPNVSDTATASYMISGGVATSTSNAALTVSGQDLLAGTINPYSKYTFTWAGAVSCLAGASAAASLTILY